MNALAWWTLKFRTRGWTLSCAFSLFSQSLAPASSSSVNRLRPQDSRLDLKTRPQDQLVLGHYCFTVVTFVDLPSHLTWGSYLTSRISCIPAQSTLYPLSIQTPPQTLLSIVSFVLVHSTLPARPICDYPPSQTRYIDRRYSRLSATLCIVSFCSP